MSTGEEPRRDQNDKLELHIEQMRSLNRWILGMLAGLIAFGGGWMIKISEDISTLKSDTGTMKIYTETTKAAVISMTEAVISASRLSTSTEISIRAIDFRLKALETEKAKGGRFTAEDGKRLEERIRILENHSNKRKDR